MTGHVLAGLLILPGCCVFSLVVTAVWRLLAGRKAGRVVTRGVMVEDQVKEETR